MKTVRLAFSAALILLIVGGYIAGQMASMGSNQDAYYAKIDQPALHLLELVLLVGSVVLALIPDREEHVP